MLGDRWAVREEEMRLWPWVGQIRVAPYSYDLVDNPGRALGRILDVEPDRALTGRGRQLLNLRRLAEHAE